MATRKPSKVIPIRMCKGQGSEILKCSGQIKEDQFFDSWSPFKDGKMDYCKDCIDKMWDYYVDKGMTAKASLYYCCQKLDIPFRMEIYEPLYKLEQEGDKNGKKKPLTIKTYITRLLQNTTKKEIWDDFSATEVDISEIDGIMKDREASKKEQDRFILDWGENLSIGDYNFLEYRYDVYTEDKKLIPSQETLYRKLCLTELAVRRKESEGKESTNKEVDQILKLMKQLGIDQFEKDVAKSEFDLLFERQIWEMENKEPCELIDIEEYRDMCNINSQWGEEIKRAVRNLVGGTKEYPKIERIRKIKKEISEKARKKREDKGE